MVTETRAPIAPLTAWHPAYPLAALDTTPPCLPEFMTLMKCLAQDDVTTCTAKYNALKACLHNHGLPMNLK